jgi:hypothetical protein
VENAHTWWELLVPQTPPPLPTLMETSEPGTSLHRLIGKFSGGQPSSLRSRRLTGDLPVTRAKSTSRKVITAFKKSPTQKTVSPATKRKASDLEIREI